MIEKNVMVRREVRVLFWFLHIRIIFPQEGERAESSVRIPRYAAARAVVASKGLSDPVSSLSATLTGDFISVDSSRLRRAKGQRSEWLRRIGGQLNSADTPPVAMKRVAK